MSCCHERTQSVLRRPLESTQYVSIKYTERLVEAGVEPSVGSVGDSYDNALAETINGLYKAEVIHRRGPWRSFEAVEFATLEWVDWFNNRRLMEPIGNIPRRKPRNATTPCWKNQLWRRDSNEMASGKPGAVQANVEDWLKYLIEVHMRPLSNTMASDIFSDTALLVPSLQRSASPTPSN